MYVKNVDGKPIFATHEIECFDEDLIKDLPFHKDGTKLVSYSQRKTTQIMKWLKDLNIEYDIKILKQSSSVDKSTKYQNKSEILEYMQENNKPKSKRESDLKKEVEILKSQVKVLMDKLDVKY